MLLALLLTADVIEMSLVIIDLSILYAVLARCPSRLGVGYLTSPLHTYRSQTVMRRITLFSSCLCRNGCANNHYR